VFIAGAGTGGTISGVSRAIKKTSHLKGAHSATEAHNPKCIVVGIDPVRCRQNSEEILLNSLADRKHPRCARFSQYGRQRSSLRS
jgi:cysteine synthase